MIDRSIGLFVSLFDGLFHWLIDWFDLIWFDWLIDWLIDWLTGWLVDWLMDWLIDWLIERSLDCFIDRSMDRLTVDWRLIDRWVVHCLTARSTDCFVDWLIDRSIDWFVHVIDAKWFAVKEQVKMKACNEWMGEWLNEMKGNDHEMKRNKWRRNDHEKQMKCTWNEQRNWMELTWVWEWAWTWTGEKRPWDEHEIRMNEINVLKSIWNEFEWMTWNETEVKWTWHWYESEMTLKWNWHWHEHDEMIERNNEWMNAWIWHEMKMNGNETKWSEPKWTEMTCSEWPKQM